MGRFYKAMHSDPVATKNGLKWEVVHFVSFLGICEALTHIHEDS